MVNERPDDRDWASWMRGMGRYTRRLRELAGLSQEQLARHAGVSQGALSRLEMGRAVNTPLITVMRVNAAMREALAALDPQVLSNETQCLMSVPRRGVPLDGEGFDQLAITTDPRLAELIQVYWNTAPRSRHKLVALVAAAAALLAGDAADSPDAADVRAPANGEGRRRARPAPDGAAPRGRRKQPRSHPARAASRKQ